jgi:hypothetical protein
MRAEGDGRDPLLAPRARVARSRCLLLVSTVNDRKRFLQGSVKLLAPRSPPGRPHRVARTNGIAVGVLGSVWSPCRPGTTRDFATALIGRSLPSRRSSEERQECPYVMFSRPITRLIENQRDVPCVTIRVESRARPWGCSLTNVANAHRPGSAVSPCVPRPGGNPCNAT